MSRTYSIVFRDNQGNTSTGKMRCHFVKDDQHGHAIVRATLAIDGYTLISIKG